MMVQSHKIPLDEELLPVHNLTFGNFSCMYEHGRIRYVKSGSIEVIRMIYFAVRDTHWKTADYNIQDEVIEIRGKGFAISYTALHQLHEIVYRTDVKIEASENQIVFRVNGEAETSFHRNRIGICVLQPVKEYTGQEVHVTTPDGSRYDAHFPVLISPHQPFKEISRLQSKAAGEINVEFTFEGDIFETEDQRNWADSSFKIYSTPLTLPLPVAVTKGDRLEQAVSIKITGSARPFRTVAVGETKLPFPKIGYGSVSEDLNETGLALLSQLPLHHYLVAISMLTTGWESLLSQKCKEAIQLKTTIELAVVFSENVSIDLERLLVNIERLNAPIGSMLLLQQGKPVMPKESFVWLYSEIKKLYPAMKVGFGTDGFFADLNRNRPSFEEFDFVRFSLNPQVHASDTRSVMENLQQLRDLVQSARSISRNKPVYISPITFKIRAAGGLDSDSRQHRNLGALWTLVAIKNLANADQLTFYEVSGQKGVIQPNPTPLFNLLKLIKSFNPKWIIEKDNGNQLWPDKVVLENENGERLVIDIG